MYRASSQDSCLTELAQSCAGRDRPLLTLGNVEECGQAEQDKANGAGEGEGCGRLSKLLSTVIGRCWSR